MQKRRGPHVLAQRRGSRVFEKRRRPRVAECRVCEMKRERHGLRIQLQKREPHELCVLL